MKAANRQSKECLTIPLTYIEFNALLSVDFFLGAMLKVEKKDTGFPSQVQGVLTNRLSVKSQEKLAYFTAFRNQSREGYRLQFEYHIWLV